MARGRALTAAALLRTAQTLAGGDPALGLRAAACVLAAGHVAVAERMLAALPADLPGGLAAGVDALTEMAAEREDTPLETIETGRHLGLRLLAARLTALAGDDLSLLDVGGGDGLLGLFLPGARYAVADAAVNGISPLELPFGEHSFDAVCASHVLERIAPEDRVACLDQLLVRARRHVVLLTGPATGAARRRERRDLLTDLFGGTASGSDRDPGSLEPELVERFAAARGLVCERTPAGALSTELALDVAAYYARLADRAEDLPRIHAFVNGWSAEALTSERLPAVQLVVLSRVDPAG
jgi:hypothetical protein